MLHCSWNAPIMLKIMLIVSYITLPAIRLSQLQIALLMFGTSEMVGSDASLQRNFSVCRAEQLPCRNLQALIRELTTSCYRRNWLWVSRRGGLLLATARCAQVLSDHSLAWQHRLLQSYEALEQRWGRWKAKDGTTSTLLGSSLSLDESLETTIGASRSRVHDTLILTL